MDPSVEESVPGAGTWRVGSASVQRLATGPSRVCGDGERQRREIIHAALLDMGMSQDLSAEAALKIGVGSIPIGVDFCLYPDTRARVRNEAQMVPQKTGLRSQGPASLRGLNAPPPANLLANAARVRRWHSTWHPFRSAMNSRIRACSSQNMLRLTKWERIHGGRTTMKAEDSRSSRRGSGRGRSAYHGPATRHGKTDERCLSGGWRCRW